MSKEIVKAGQKYLVASSDESLRKDIGGALVLAGGGGLAIMGLAALIPFVNALVLLIAVLGLGIFVWAK